MISREDIQRLIHRPTDGGQVVSLFLDMSVTSDNKRTYDIFLRDQRSRVAELNSERETGHRETIGRAFAEIERWIDTSFDPTSKGVAIYVSPEANWIEAFQLPVPLENRLEVADRPLVGPLARVVEENRRHGIIVVDREHLRIIDVYLGIPMHEHTVEPEPLPVKSDVQKGGYSQSGFQRRKAEETRHFYKEFVSEINEFLRQHPADDLVVAGTDENVKAFLEFLPDQVRKLVVHTCQAPVLAPTTDILDRVRPFFVEQVRRSEEEIVGVLRGRMSQRHFAATGFRDTLEQLQEGKVDTLIIARDVERHGAQCTQCGFYMIRRDDGHCPYCGGATRDSVDLVETMIRIAADQEVPIEFVEPQALGDVNGVGALLKF